MTKLNFVGLGGMTELGMKLYILEVNNEIYIFDSGMKYPDDVMFGIDKIIPDMSYVRDNAERVKAIFISNISDSNIGSITMLLRFVQAPIYASHFTNEIIKPLLTNRKQKFVALKSGKAVKVENIKVTAFNMTYSTPGNLGFFVETEAGNVVYVSDYVFNQNVGDSYATDLAYLATLGKKNVLALISSAKGAETVGFGANNPAFYDELSRYTRQMQGSMFLSIFTKNLLDIQEAIYVAEAHHKKVCIIGRRGYEIISTAFRNKQLRMQQGTLVTFKNIKSVPRENVMYLVLGDEGVPYDLMLHILSDTHREVRVHPEDMLVVAVSKVPGSELKISSVIDVAFQKNVTAHIMDYKNVMADTAGIEDMKLLQNFVKPKYLIVGDAEFRQLVEFQKHFTKHGQEEHENNVILVDSGEWISFEDGEITQPDKENFILDDILINGELFEDSDNYVLKEREQLSADGAVILTVAILENENIYQSQYLHFQSLGFIPEDEQKNLIKEIKQEILALIDRSNTKHRYTINELKKRIQETINQTIYREIRRYPIVIVQFIVQNNVK